MYTPNLSRRWLTSSLVIAAASLPSVAQARPMPDSFLSVGSSAAVSGPSAQQSGPSAQSGFQWGDAGLGAAGTVVLLTAGAAAAGAARRRRTQRTIAG